MTDRSDETDLSDENGQDGLLRAIRQKRDDTVLMLLNAGADPNLAKPASELPPRLRAAQDAELLAAHGLIVGTTPLIEAAASGHVGSVRHLLDAGAELDRTDALGRSAFWTACHRGSIEIVDCLLAAGASWSPNGPGPQPDPLHAALDGGHRDLALRLLDAGGEVANQDSAGTTALIKAAASADVALVCRLLELGASVREASRDGRTALCRAAGACHWVAYDPSGPDSDEALLMSGQQFEFDEASGGVRTLQPYPEAEILAVLEVLLEAGADPNPNSVEDPPLAEASRLGYLAVMKRLLKAGAKVTHEAVDNARIYEQAAAAKLLRDNGPPVSPEDEGSEDRWGEELSIPGLKPSNGYLEFIDDLAARLSTSPECLDPALGLYEIRSAKGYEELDAIQREGLQQGAYVYLCGKYPSFGSPVACTIRVLPTSHFEDVMAVERINGAEQGVGPGYIAAWMRQLADEHPLSVTWIGHDCLAGRFHKPLVNPRALAETMRDFSPDAVAQAYGDVETLAARLQTTGQFMFWWD